METTKNDLCPYIYRFLLQKKMTDLAKTFGKLSKSSAANVDEPTLVDFYDEWLKCNDKSAILDTRSAKPGIGANSVSSSEDSSGDENTKPSNNGNKDKSKSAVADDSDSDTSSDDDSEQAQAPAKGTTINTPQSQKPGLTNDKSQSAIKKRKHESSSDEEESSSDDEPPAKKKCTTPQGNNNKENLNLSNSNFQNNAESMSTSTPMNNASTPLQNPAFSKTPKSNGRKSGKSTPNTPFRRVRDEEVEIGAKFADNSFGSKRDSWGEAAHNILKHTRGKNFRREKTKLKRGNYRGGSISMEVCSIKFEDDSD